MIILQGNIAANSIVNFTFILLLSKQNVSRNISLVFFPDGTIGEEIGIAFIPLPFLCLGLT